MAGTINRGIAVRARAQGRCARRFHRHDPFLGIMLTGHWASFSTRREKWIRTSCRSRGACRRSSGVVAFAINALLITIRILFFMPSRNTSMPS